MTASQNPPGPALKVGPDGFWIAAIHSSARQPVSPAPGFSGGRALGLERRPYHNA